MSTVISKDNLDNIFFNLTKRIQKQLKHFNVVLYITGGANLVHGTLHRESTLDIDVLKQRSIDLRDIIVDMCNEFDLPYNWLNDSVMYSASYSNKLSTYVGDERTF